MKVNISYIMLALIFLTISCNEVRKKENNKDQTLQNNLKVDHVSIWVEDVDLAKQKLTEIGFTTIPDSLLKAHEGQGTAGKFFNFLNCYLELIYVNDEEELVANNKLNEALDFTLRANSSNNGAAPYGIGLKMGAYLPEEIPFKTLKYHQEWMDKEVNIYSAVNSKLNLLEPSIFVVPPTMAGEEFEHLDSLKNIPEEYALWRSFYKHKNGAEKLSKIVITSGKVDLLTKTMKACNGIDLLEIRNGENYLMELYFDNERQSRAFDLRPELPLKIYL